MAAGTDTDAEAARVHARFLEIAPGVSDALSEAIRGLGPRRFPDRSDVPLATFLARAVVGQQLSTAAARSIWSRIEAAAVESGVALPELFRPGHEDRLRACGLSRAKIRALAGIRAAHCEGGLAGERLHGLDHAAIADELLALWGVGQWTCDMTALFYCGCRDVWPEQDVTVRRTFARLIGPRRKPARWAARFAPERSWLALYLWALADARPD